MLIFSPEKKDVSMQSHFYFLIARVYTQTRSFTLVFVFGFFFFFLFTKSKTNMLDAHPL
jgi:hypothetical protein